MLRGNRDFSTRKEYKTFLENLFSQLNANRQDRFKEELALLRALPNKHLSACTRLCVSVGPSSTIRVKDNIYSVHSRLIKEKVTVRIYAERLEIWQGQSHVESIPRLIGSSKHKFNIDTSSIGLYGNPVSLRIIVTAVIFSRRAVFEWPGTL